jgi:hypothetical protein
MFLSLPAPTTSDTGVPLALLMGGRRTSPPEPRSVSEEDSEVVLVMLPLALCVLRRTSVGRLAPTRTLW